MCILQFAPLNSAIGTPLLENAFVMLSYIPLYFLFARHIANDADFAPSVREMLFLATITMCILPMAFLEPVLFANSRVGYVYLIVIEVVVGYGMLGFQYLMYYNAKQMAHVVVENELSKRRVEQYEGFRGVVEVMNHKIHDLKHQVRDLAAEHAVNTEVIDGITETVTDYETFIHTGNEPLDTILTEKKFVCVSRKIGMKCIVDGAAFSFLSVEDTNALFGNLLDNATEYLSSVDENFRLLSIFSSRTEHFLKLAVENYFDGDRIELDKKGFPITNKHDTLMHGFGTRSVARIAEKHGGHATFRVEDGLFKAHVIFPTDI